MASSIRKHLHATCDKLSRVPKSKSYRASDKVYTLHVVQACVPKVPFTTSISATSRRLSCWFTITGTNIDPWKIASQPKVGKDFNSCKKEPRRLHSNNVLRPPMSGRGGLQLPRNQDTTDDSLDAALSRDRGETRQGS